MLTLIVILFAIAVIFGLINISHVLKTASPPSSAVYAHGAAAVVGLGLLIYFALQNPGTLPQWVLIVFIVAALGGLTLVYNDRVRKKPGPSYLAVVHMLAALTAFVGLLLFVFGSK